MSTTPADTVLVEVEGLTRYFGPRPAVADLDLRAHRGEVVGLLGPNGAGKTTTMRMLAGLLAPTSGRVRIAGVDLAEDPIGARRHVGYLPEQVALYEEMTVVAYLRFMARIHRVSRRRVRTLADAAIEETGLAEVRKRVVGVLSKGFRQRVGLAAALVHEPALMILDEPTSALDPRQVVEIRRLIATVAKGRTVLLSTHILPEASTLCDRVVIMSAGRAVAAGSPTELARQVAARSAHVLRVRVRAASGDVASTLRRVPGVESVEARAVGDGETVASIRASADVAPDIARTVGGAGWDLLELTSETASLEQVFLTLTT